jgi:hypothetical protein
MIIQLEKLTISKAYHYTIFAANKVEKQKQKLSKLYALVYNAKRFILKFRLVIKLALLQIYNSVFLFSPQASIV